MELGVVDIRRWLDSDRTGPAAPECRSKVDAFTGMVLQSTLPNVEMGQIRCWRLRCGGALRTLRVRGTDRIAWECTVCGHRGVLTGWRGLLWDMSEHAST